MHRRAPHATTISVTVTTGEIAEAQIAEAGTNADGVAAWETLRANGDIQFAPIEIPPPTPPPSWLLEFIEALGEFFVPVTEALGMPWPVFKWVLLGLALLLFLFILWRIFLWRIFGPVLRIRFKNPAEEKEEEWAPDHSEALTLLEDADRLAAEGHFDEATHLLLQRSVGQIAEARPDWLEPSSTAREIAQLPALPEAARFAFSAIAELVERSLFALRQLDAQDWHSARTAYAEFALADFSASGAQTA